MCNRGGHTQAATLRLAHPPPLVYDLGHKCSSSNADSRSSDAQLQCRSQPSPSFLSTGTLLPPFSTKATVIAAVTARRTACWALSCGPT